MVKILITTIQVSLRCLLQVSLEVGTKFTLLLLHFFAIYIFYHLLTITAISWLPP